MTPEATIQQISAALGASWASGINLYATLLSMGLLHMAGAVTLPAGLDYIATPIVMVAAGVMFFVEFFADKIPGFDTAWDGMHTFIRIPAGIVLAYGAAEGMGPGLEFAAAIIGGGMATTTHAAKSGNRVMINTSPEPVSNWTASFMEDIAVIGGVWTALTHPWVFLCLLVVFILLMIWLLPKIWRGVKKIFGFVFRRFGGGDESAKGSTAEKPPPPPD